MDFLTQKELNGLKGDLKASEIAINADKENFQKKLIEQYGKEMESVFEPQTIKKEQESTEEKKNTCWLKKLFSLN